MRRALFSAVVASALTLGGTAGAQTVDFGTVCGSVGGSMACARASATLFVGYMEVRVQNAEGPTGVGDPSRITGFGLYYFGASMGPAGTLGSPVPGGGWANGFAGGGGALDNPGPAGAESWLLRASVGGNGGVWGCTDPTGTTADVSSCAGPLVFRFDGIDHSRVRLGDLQFAFRAQSIGADDASLKCYPTDHPTAEHSCLVTMTATPEPATLGLLGLGLFGLGSLAVARRRKRDE